MPFVAVPDKNSGDVFTTAMWSTFVEGNLNAGVSRPLWDSGILAAATSSIDILSIPQTFAHLRVLLHGRGDAAVTNEFVTMRINGDATTSYDDQSALSNTTALTGAEALASAAGRCLVIPAGSGAANWFGGGEFLIPNYTSTTGTKMWIGISNGRYNTTTGTGPIYLIGGTWRSLPAVTRLTLFPQSGGNFIAGSRVTVEGVGYI